MNIIISPEIRAAAPDFKVITIEADVENAPTSPEIIADLDSLAATIRERFELGDINKRPGIAATRRAYKSLGKDPNRYRPSSDALCRRAVKGMELYHISNLVDIINIVSMASGYSIGGFDVDKIDGDTLTLGVGRENEEYEGIGRGQLNIAGMPVYRDATGGVGTPTSDHVRTQLDFTTKRLLICINIYGEELPVRDTVALASQLLFDHCNARHIRINTWSCSDIIER